MALFDSVLVVVLGGGDLASGVIYRLHKAGFPVLVTELSAPLLVRRAVCYGEAVYSGEVTVDGLTAQCVDSLEMVPGIIANQKIPVIVDESGNLWQQLSPTVIVDARMEKRNLGIHRDLAPLVIALGPGFVAGEDSHCVIETNRGHNLGRVIWQGAAEPDTGQPGSVNGKTNSRVLRAPTAGFVRPHTKIGDIVKANALVAEVDAIPVYAPFDGVVRGLIHEQVHVAAGFKIGDIDPRGDIQSSFTISDKSLSIGGGVVEAVLSSKALHRKLVQDKDEAAQSVQYRSR